MDSINSVIQLFESEKLSTLIKLIERMRQISVNAHLKSLLLIYAGVYFCKVAGCKPFQIELLHKYFQGFC